MFIRPQHYWLAAAASLLMVFMLAVAAQTMIVINETSLDEIEPPRMEKAVTSAENLDDPLGAEESGEPPREVVILPPFPRNEGDPRELPESWKEMLDVPVVVEVEEPPKPDGPMDRRYDKLVESIGKESDSPVEDTKNISDRDMIASSLNAAADSDGEAVPTINEGRDDERLDSIVETEFGEGELPSASSALNPGDPLPVSVAGSSGGASKTVEELVEIPGLDQVPVLPELPEAETEEGEGLANEGDSTKEGSESPVSDDDGDSKVTSISGGGSGDIQRLKRRYRGRLDSRGIDSLAARGTEIGKYLSAASKRVTKNWQRACNDPINGQYITNGMIRLIVAIDANGTVSTVYVEHADGVTEVQKNFTRDSVKSTPLPPFPDSLKAEIGSEPIEIVYDFLFFVG